MVSVTARIKEVKQPRGGYINPKKFSIKELVDEKQLYATENIHPITVGLTVDYMTRYMLNADKREAFKISLAGAERVQESPLAKNLLNSVKGLDDESIINASKLTGFDVVVRAGAMAYKPEYISSINPDAETINNIRIMVDRSLNFFKEYGPITKEGFTFEYGGYTTLVNSGDGDFLTETTLWDFKVSKAEPKKEATLQLLMYYLMGLRSIHKEFQSIKQLGIYNPRLNKVYLLNIDDIPQDIIEKVSSEVIGY